MPTALPADEKARRKIERHMKGVVDALREYSSIDDDKAAALDLEDTPARVARMLVDDMHQPGPIPMKHLKWTDVELDEADAVSIGPIGFSSMCAHHMLPFYGHFGVSYLHGGRLLGLSKFTRIVDHYSRTFQLQEYLTRQVANQLVSTLRPRALLVVSQASHGCVTCRGVRDPDQRTTCATLIHTCEDDDVDVSRDQVTAELYRLLPFRLDK